ncbi:MAG: SUMF1/EgtB/PvdO family nonheme iron enzyme [Myxococcales bacterium]|nr:SUMF1/EgtB/PvdO family nonheme iron enzyme [Myxococcales bacterium]
MPQPHLEIGPVPSVADVEFIERLGEGMGAGRFKARLAEDDRPVVSLLLEDGTRIDRQAFADWAHRLGKLDHPGIPRLIQLERVLEPAYAAFEYIDGQNLEVRVALRGKGLPEVEALAVVMQAAAAIQAAHRAGVAHGFLNPRSIILAPRDGGIDAVRVVGWSPATRVFEQAARDDVRGLGQLLYTAITGVLPPSATRPRVGEPLDGDGGDVGAFDDILMDWVDVERDLRGMGAPALRAISDRSYPSVDAFIDELLPHFRHRVNETIDQIDADLSRDLAFKAEVDSRRERQRELEAKLRYVRDWLREHQPQIERVEAQMERLDARERSLRALEVEVAMLTDRPARGASVAPRGPRRPARRRRPACRTSPRAAAPRAPVRAPLAAAETPTPAPDVVEQVLLSRPTAPVSEVPPGRQRLAPKDRAKGGEGLLVAAMAVAIGAGVGGAAWLMTREPDPAEKPAAEQPAAEKTIAEKDPSAPRRRAVAAAPAERDAAPPPPRPTRAWPPSPRRTPRRRPRTPRRSPTPPPAACPTRRARAARAPVVVGPPGPAGAPPEGMVAVPGGVLRPHLSADAFALLEAQCKKDVLGVRSMNDCAGILETERAAPPVTVKPFFIDALEVSQAEYLKCRDAGASCYPLHLTWDLQTQPATGVTHEMAAFFCEWRGGRLPTADEWLFAAGGADGRAYPWGNDSIVVGDKHKANIGRAGVRGGYPERADGHKYAGPVDAFADRNASPFGASNMSGNVREWTATPTEDGHFVVMGGGWRDAPYEHRVTRRESVDPKTFANDLGFRCVVDVGGR